MFLFFLFGVLISCSQNTSKQETKIEDNNSCIPFDLKHNCISLRVSVCDSINGDFAIDNGNSFTFFDSVFFYSHFDTSQFHIIKDKDLSFFGFQSYKGEIPIAIGKHKFTVKEFRVCNCAKLGIPNLNGIIGEEPFLNKVTTIDFDKQTISFLDSSHIPFDCIQVPMLQPKGKQVASNQKFIEIELFKNDNSITKGYVEFDLGCIGTDLQVKHSVVKSLRKRESITGESLLTTVQKTQTKFWKIDSIFIGKQCVKNIIATTSHVSVKNETNVDPMVMFTEGDGYLGLNFFRRFNLIADYKKNILYLKPNTHFETNFSE
jgi:hypothetical protein